MSKSKDTLFCLYDAPTGKKLQKAERPLVAGILNNTNNSFYDGGRYNTMDGLLEHAQWLLDEGADWIDLGANSTRPGSVLLTPEEETARLVPVVKMLRETFPGVPLSVDTCFATCAEQAVKAGASIINDIGGGRFDEQMLPTVAALQVPYVLTHNASNIMLMHAPHAYTDVVRDVVHFFSRQLETLYRMGATDVMLDPGFGFAKNRNQEYELLRRLGEVDSIFTEPLYVGVSRKRMACEPTGCKPQTALNATTVLNTMALERGARILRVHDPRQAREAIAIVERALPENEKL